MNTKKLWISFILVMTISFAVLIYYGREIYRQAPPIPDKVMTTDGKILFTGEDILDGQNVWQSVGGQEIGTVWGHGAYQAPDWSADWLHKEAVFMLDKLALKADSLPYNKVSHQRQAALKVRLQEDIRQNTYQDATKTLTVSYLRAEAIASNTVFYSGLFTNNPAMASLRNAYALPANSLKDPERVRQLNAFFFWISWACVTQRPGQEISYTNNWPADELVGNRPTGELLLWTGFSVMMLLAGIGLMVWYYAKKRDEKEEEFPKVNPQLKATQSPSQKATLKYFWIVSILLLVQVIMGVITAHYGVEGHAFYGIPLGDWLPYSISRTWHVQIAIFWIATSWLATGLYYAPAISGVEPRFQRLGVNFLFSALLVIVAGSLAGQWMGVMQKLGLVQNFWFGHQGYENIRFAKKMNVPFVDADYDTANWFDRVKGLEFEPERGARCSACFDMRFERTALYAHEHDFKVIVSSLGMSRWKDMDQVNACGTRAARRYEGMVYWTYNWRKNGGSARMYEISKREGFYQQKYCGCVYSLRDIHLNRVQRGN